MKTRKAEPSEKEIVRSLQETADDHVWVDQHKDDLLRDYEDQWIAVKAKKVIGSDPDFDTLLKKVPDHAERCIEYVTRERLEMIL